MLMDLLYWPRSGEAILPLQQPYIHLSPSHFKRNKALTPSQHATAYHPLAWSDSDAPVRGFVYFTVADTVADPAPEYLAWA